MLSSRLCNAACALERTGGNRPEILHTIAEYGNIISRLHTKRGMHVGLHVGGCSESFRLSVSKLFREFLSANERSHITSRESSMSSRHRGQRIFGAARVTVYIQYHLLLSVAEIMHRFALRKNAYVTSVAIGVVGQDEVDASNEAVRNNVGDTQTPLQA